MSNKSYTYILGNQKPILYIGSTSDLKKRIKRHRGGHGAKFTKKYKPNKLLYFEEYTDLISARDRERQLKNWHREWKINLIKSKNPEFKDLSSTL